MSPRRNRWLFSGLLLLAGAALLVWWQQETAAAPGPTVPRTAATELTNAPASAVPVAGAPSPRVEAPAAPPPTPEQPAASLAHLRGRCVAAEDGRPLRGCRVEFRGWGRNRQDGALQGKVDWNDPEPYLTADDGRFDIPFDPPASFQFGLDVLQDGRVPRTGRWSRIEKHAVIDLGDIRMQPGFPVRGRVVDLAGIPVPRVGVHLARLPLPLHPEMGANDQRHGFSTAGGEFQIGVPIPPGQWPLGISAYGFRVVSPDLVSVDPIQGADPVQVVVQRQPSIAGSVVDEFGAPVEGVALRVQKNESGRYASARSRDDGSFEIFAVDADPKPARLTIFDPGPCEPGWTHEGLIAWGTRDLRVQLRRALSFELAVVERGTGQPVEAYAISCYHESANSSLQKDLRLGGEHPGGVVVVDRVWRGKNYLLVRPSDPVLVASEPVRFEALEGGIPAMRIELDRLRTTTVRAVDRHGDPVVGCIVEVITKGIRPFTGDRLVSDPRTGRTVTGGEPGFRPHEVCSSAVTNEQGRAERAIPPQPADLILRIRSDRHPKLLVHPAPLQPDSEFVVTVSEGGGMAGEVAGADFGSMKLCVEAAAAGPPAAFGEKHRAEIGPQGSFALSGMLPGSYAMKLLLVHRFQTETGGGHDIALDMAIPPVQVEAGKVVQVRIDAGPLQPATLRGRILIDGSPPVAARMFVMNARGERFGQFVVGPEGAFEATGLLPGCYRIATVLGDLKTSEGDPVFHEDAVTLRPGDSLERNFAFLRRRLVVRILGTDGKPAANQSFQLSGGSVFLRRQTDAEGRIVLDPAPMVPLQVWPQPPISGMKEPPQVVMPASRTEHEVTLVLRLAAQK